MNLRSNQLNTHTLFNTTLLSSDNNYRVQQWNIPGISCEHPVISSRSGNMNLQSERVDYEPLDIKLIGDQNLILWKEIVGVFQTYHIPSTNTSEKKLGQSWVEVYNSKNEYLFKIVFHDCYIKSLDSLDYTTMEDNEAVIIGMTIVYDYYTIE